MLISAPPILFDLKCWGEGDTRHEELLGLYQQSWESRNGYPVFRQVYGRKGVAFVTQRGNWAVANEENSMKKRAPVIYSSHRPVLTTPPAQGWAWRDGRQWREDKTLTMAPVDPGNSEVHCLK